MTVHRVLKIGRWVVDFVFATKVYDVQGILSCLYDAGAAGWMMDEAEELMSEGGYNTGFTYANPGIHRAVVVVGPTTSGAEFTNTLTHEIHHLAVAIASELGIEKPRLIWPGILRWRLLKSFANLVASIAGVDREVPQTL